IEGAHEGRGLGHRFLRHIERNSVLLFMIPADTNRSIDEEYQILLKELQEFNPELLDKPRLLAVTKSDLIDKDLEKLLRPTLPTGIEVLFISALANKNIMALKELLWKYLNN
ncbi:MAG: GTPase ObgE, partial [Saprospiraceae bacterium]